MFKMVKIKYNGKLPKESVQISISGRAYKDGDELLCNCDNMNAIKAQLPEEWNIEGEIKKKDGK